MKKIILGLILNVLLLQGSASLAQATVANDQYKRLKAHYESSIPAWVKRFKKSILTFQQQDSLKGNPTYDVVFIGSSTFERWKTMQQDFAPAKVINRGFGGSTIREVIYYADRILYPYKPRVVVLYVGNDVWGLPNELSTDDLFAYYQYFEQTLHQRLPDAILNFVSMRPSPRKRNLIDRQKAISDRLKDYAQIRKNCHFIDIWSVMYTPGGQLRTDMFAADSLHLNSAGNLLLTDVIKPQLLAQLKKTAK